MDKSRCNYFLHKKVIFNREVESKDKLLTYINFDLIKMAMLGKPEFEPQLTEMCKQISSLYICAQITEKFTLTIQFS